MEVHLYNIKVASLDKFESFDENLSFRTEPNNKDVIGYLRLIRPSRQFSMDSMTFTYIGQLDKNGKLVTE